MPDRPTTSPGVPSPEALQAAIEGLRRDADSGKIADERFEKRLAFVERWVFAIVGPNGDNGRIGDLKASQQRQGARIGALEAQIAQLRAVAPDKDDTKRWDDAASAVDRGKWLLAGVWTIVLILIAEAVKGWL